jgi:predicted permease
MARSFAELRDVHPGFDAGGVLTVRASLPRASYTDPAVRLRFLTNVLDQVQALPGVVSAAVTDWLPLSDDHNDSIVILEDHPAPANATPPDHPLAQVSPTYFATLGIPVLRGRTFTAPDPTRPSSEALVSKSFADMYWKGGDPIGKRLKVSPNGPWFTIIGVVGDVHMESLEKAAEQFVYLPLFMTYENGPQTPNYAAVTLRAQGDAAAQMTALRGIVRTLDPGVALYGERLLSQRLNDATARMRFVTLMLGVSSLVALAIGMVGLYGVLAYGVTLRRREIGVRMALGASTRDVTRMIARHGVKLAGVGVGVGLVGAVAGTRLLRGLLYGVSPTDTLTLASTCLVLLVVATVASWLPARRAASIDPMEALRRD